MRARLDGYLGLEPNDPFEPLATGEYFDPEHSPPTANTTTLARLLLLDGAGLDSVLTALAARPYELYDTGDPRSNIMTTTLPGAPGPDGVAATDRRRPSVASGRRPGVAPGEDHGGNGNFPLFESCVLRGQAFRALFDDWENDDTPGIGDNDGVLDASEDFPDLGDTTSFDPNDPLPPNSALVVGSPSVFDPGTTWVGTSTR